MNLAERCLGSDDRDDAIVIVDDHGHPLERVDRTSLRQRVESRAASLAATGVGRGDIVALVAHNTIAFCVDLLALLYVGAVAAPLSPLLVERERLDALARIGARQLLHDGAATHPGGVARAADVAADDPAWIVLTSGTTGAPRAVVHAARAIDARAAINRAWTTIGPGDRVLHTGRLNWTYAFGSGLLDPLANGATAVLLANDAGRADLAAIVERTGATILATVPGVVRPLLRVDDLAPLRRLRHAVVAGEQLSASLFASWAERVGIELREALGMSECSTYVSSGPFAPPRAGWAGRQQPGRGRVAVLSLESSEPVADGEVGRLAIAADDPGLMLGYRDAPLCDSGLLVDDWFVGGDLAVRSTDGYVRWMGRSDGLLNNLGYRVAATEIESVITSLVGVREVVVTEVPRDDGVGILTAFVVAEPDAALTRDALVAHADSALATFKRPRQWRIIDALPRTAAGKVDRNALRTSAR